MDITNAAILVTGGAGFIGSNFIRYVFEKTDFKGIIINVDALTYAGNLENLADIHNAYSNSRYFFVKDDICNFEALNQVFATYNPSVVVHFAAESHVDRSIVGPKDFITTNIVGTFNLLECARYFWDTTPNTENYRFHHISTDEVYGSLGQSGYFYETTAYDPHSPYSASKASSDHLVRAYYHTFGLPVTISNCSNNYGPYQFPEKLIPLMILNMIEGKPLPVYGDGKNVRDWLYVEDHASAVWTILQKGRVGQTYNIGGENEWTNIELVRYLCDIMQQLKPIAHETVQRYADLITFVKDRPGHDRRYSINCDKIKHELGWKQSVSFDEGLLKTVQWYLDNQEWVRNVKSGVYKEWLEINYDARG